MGYEIASSVAAMLRHSIVNVSRVPSRIHQYRSTITEVVFPKYLASFYRETEGTCLRSARSRSGSNSSLMDISGLMIEVAWRLSRSPSMHNNKSKAEHTNLFNREHSMYTAIVIFVTDEQRQVLKEDGVPMPLVDGDEGKCYMVMPVEFSSERDGVFRARMPGFHAMAEAEVPSDAAMTLAILVRKMLEHG